MATKITTLVSIGFKSWWKNLVVVLPYLFSGIATSIVAILALLIALPIVKISIPDLIKAFSSQELATQFFQQLITNISNPTTIFLLVLIVIIYLIISLLLTSYFSSGALGMIDHYFKLNQKPGLKEMHEYGKKFMWRYFSFQLITGVVFLLFLAAFFIPLIASNGAVIWIILFAIALLIVIVLSLFLFLAPYIIITQDCSLGTALQKSFRTVGKQFWPFIGLGCLWALIGMAFSLISMIPAIGQMITSLANVLAIEPASGFSYILFAKERAQ